MPTGTEQLLLELFAIFVSAKMIGELFERFSLPSVLGEILAGAVLGLLLYVWYAAVRLTPAAKRRKRLKHPR